MRSGAARRSGAGQDGTPTGRFAHETTVPLAPRGSKTTVLNDSPEARTKEILCKPMGEHNERLTRGLSAGPRALFVPGCRPMDRRLFVPVNPFHARHVGTNFYTMQNNIDTQSLFLMFNQATMLIFICYSRITFKFGNTYDDI